MSFFLGSAGCWPAPPFGLKMLGVGRAAPAQFPAAGREFTAHSRRRPEGRLGDPSIPFRDFKISILTITSSSSQATYRLRRAFFTSLQNSSRAHSAAPPRFQTGPTALGSGLSPPLRGGFFIGRRTSIFIILSVRGKFFLKNPLEKPS